MRRRRWVMSIILAAVASAATPWVPSASAEPAPYLTLRESPAFVSDSTTLYVGGLEPSTAYQVSVDHGGLGPSHAPTVDVTTGASATTFDVSYVLTTSYPAPATINFTMTKLDDPTPLASLSAGVQPPIVGSGAACPGQPVSVGGSSVPDGQYRITNPAGTQFEATGVDGNLSGTPIPLLARIPAGYAFTVTEERTRDLIGSARVEVRQSYLSLGGGQTPWRDVYIADCFAPGERVATKPVPGATAPTVLANSKGVATIVVNLHPAQHVQSAAIAPTGVTSGQTIYPDVMPNIQVPATTLLVNHSLGPGIQPYALASAVPPGGPGGSGGFTFHPNYGNLMIEHYYASGGSSATWFSTGHTGSCNTCRLTMQADGNLVYRAASGHVQWSTGTAKTGSNNRLVLSSDGSLVLRTSAGYPLWSRTYGLIRGSNGYTSRITIYGHRDGSRLSLSGRAYQRTKLAGTVYSGYRKVYLQRYAHGHWTTMLGQTADSSGAVGFTLTARTAYRYRFVVTKSSTAAAAQSGALYH